MCEVDEQLAQLIQETIQYSPESMEYQIRFTQIMSLMQQSNKIMPLKYNEDVDAYQDGLLDAWVWLRRNLPSYDPSRASIFTWFNRTLSYRILNRNITRLETDNNFQPPYFDRESGEWINPIDRIPAPPQPSYLVEEIQNWLEVEQEKLTLMYVRNCPQANCYSLLHRRLPYSSPTPWKILAEEFNSNSQTLSSHYQNKCLPCLKKWLQKQGHLD
jgi:hypothetical protein